MDKSWISKLRWSSDYIESVENFLKFVTQSQSSAEKILCPCKFCINRYFHYVKDVKFHLLSKGFFPGYVVWNRHGEEHSFVAEVIRSEAFNDTGNDTGNDKEVQIHDEQPITNDIEGLLRDTFCSGNANFYEEQNENNTDQTNDDTKKFDNLLLEAEA